MNRRKIAWCLWAIGAVLIVLFWFSVVPVTLGWTGFAFALGGCIFSAGRRRPHPARSHSSGQGEGEGEGERATPSAPRNSSNPDAPQSFGYKCQWLAIRGDDPSKVAQALGLTEVQQCSWERGIALAYEGRMFVTPPINGWILAPCFSLPEAGSKDHPDLATPFLQEIGKHFHEVQYFGTHRVVEYHAWARVLDGAVVRAYAYVGERGETLWDVGARTAEEAELGVTFFDERSPEAQDDAYWERKDLTYPDEEYVMRIAGKWSINPEDLESMGLPPSTGLLGRLPKNLADAARGI